MRQVEVEGIRWLEVKVLNEENIWEEICIDSICVSSFSPSAVQLIYSCAAANEVLTNVIEMHAACIGIDGAASAATSVTQLVKFSACSNHVLPFPYCTVTICLRQGFLS